MQGTYQAYAVNQQPAVAVGVPMAQPATKLIEVIVPANVMPGQLIEVRDPQTGVPVQAVVPQGVGPGMRFEIQVPAGPAPMSPGYPVGGAYAVQDPNLYGKQAAYGQQPGYGQPGVYSQGVPGQVGMNQYQQQKPPKEEDGCCGGFLAGLCFCCTLSALLGAAGNA